MIKKKLHRYTCTAVNGYEKGVKKEDLYPLTIDADHHSEAYNMALQEWASVYGEKHADRVWDLKVEQWDKKEGLKAQFCDAANEIATLCQLARSKEDHQKIRDLLGLMKVLHEDLDYLVNGHCMKVPG